MERVEAELFTDGGNNAVVRLPGRRFPGVLIQGDSLSILRSDVAEVPSTRATWPGPGKPLASCWPTSTRC
jgi:hypothetical protein